MLRQLMSCFPKRKAKDLIRAAEDGRLDLVRNLLKAGANPNAKSDGDVTVLMWAAARGHVEVVKVLLEAGADPSIKDDDGKTAAELANDEVAKLLPASEGEHTPE